MGYKAFIQNKSKTTFNGCVKLTFTGKINSITEANGFSDIPIKKATPIECNNILAMADTPDFYGSIVLEFTEGQMSGYAYSRRVNYADL
jgi:hypothetical protein